LNLHCSQGRPGQTRHHGDRTCTSLRRGAAPNTRTCAGLPKLEKTANSDYGPAEWCSIRHRRPNWTPRARGGSAAGGGGRSEGAGDASGAGRTLAGRTLARGVNGSRQGTGCLEASHPPSTPHPTVRNEPRQNKTQSTLSSSRARVNRRENLAPLRFVVVSHATALPLPLAPDAGKGEEWRCAGAGSQEHPKPPLL
jgi:hypothetical protein